MSYTCRRVRGYVSREREEIKDERGRKVGGTYKMLADHRIANGAEGAQYMAEVKRLLEHPMTLVV